ncbi:hypothetical protein [Curtobacterium sp. MCPF17_052]|uniref:hypothetical protein n=1 Tax=Curtobacterium sp. MCPF17_052 TaxID=2175655 RepID=UPI0011B3C9BB|nr:hypothetical protein [Curtobacterium sp. MCPF17_052]WIB13315.1 hypothetical protein DEJ36_05575 [Curtobacterium sp. MCPF17_052]
MTDVAPPHEARFDGASVHFILSQHLRKRIALGPAVKRMLDEEVALSAGWPSESSVRVAPSLAAFGRQVEQLNRLTNDLPRPEGATSWARFVFRHPRMAGPYARAVLRGLWEILTSVRIVRRRRAEMGEPVSAPTAANADESLHGDWADTIRGLEFAVRQGFDALAENIKVSAIEREFDARLYGVDPEDADPYVRLFLRNIYLTLTSELGGHEVVLEPRLLLHSRGLVQLTLALNAPDEIATSDAIDLSYSTHPICSSILIPDVYLRAKEEHLAGQWSDVEDQGRRLRAITFDEPTTISETLNLLAGVVFDVTKVQPSGSWLTYAVVMTAPGSCCDSSEDWRVQHVSDMDQLALRKSPTDGEQLRIDGGPEFATTDGTSDRLNAGSSLHVSYRPWAPGIHDLDTVLLIEHAISVHMRLAHLEQTIKRFRTRARAVERASRRAVRLFAEMRGSELRYGTAREQHTHLLNQLGATDMRATIEQGLGLLSAVSGARSDARTARLANRLAALGIVVAAIAAVPVVPDALHVLRSAATSTDGPWRAVLAGIAARPATLLVAAVAIAAAWMAIAASRALILFGVGLRHVIKRGAKSPITIDVAFDTTGSDDAQPSEAAVNLPAPAPGETAPPRGGA